MRALWAIVVIAGFVLPGVALSDEQTATPAAQPSDAAQGNETPQATAEPNEKSDKAAEPDAKTEEVAKSDAKSEEVAKPDAKSEEVAKPDAKSEEAAKTDDKVQSPTSDDEKSDAPTAAQEETTPGVNDTPAAPTESKNALSSSVEPTSGMSVNGFQIQWRGFIRTRYNAILNDASESDFVGGNDGFSLDNARLAVALKKDRLSGEISVDGAMDRRDASNTATGRVEVGLRDGFIAYRLHDAAQLKFGQFKPDFDMEELQSTRDMLFIDRAVESRGVLGVEGYNVGGLSLARQVGVQLYGFMPLSKDFRVTYALTVSNGSPGNRPLNDNEDLAYTARIAIEQTKHLVLGGGVYFNRFSTGEPPDLITDEALGWVVDLTYRRQLGAVGLVLNGQFMERMVTSVDVAEEPETKARGYHGALGLELPRGFVVAYRYAYLDPTQKFEAEQTVARANLNADSVTHHTMGVGYNCPELPASLKVNYTLVMEDEARSLDNDRVDVLVQIIF